MDARSSAPWAPAVLALVLLAVRGPAAPAAASASEGLAALADSLEAAGAWARADSVARLGLDLARGDPDCLPGELADWMLRAGSGRLALGRPEEAVRGLEAALDQVAALEPPDPNRELAVHRLLERAYAERPDLERAEAEAQRCVRLAESRFGDSAPETAIDLARLAAVLLRQDRLDEAATLLDRAEGRLPRESTAWPGARAALLELRADLARADGDLGAAAAAFAASLALREQISGPRHPEILRSLRGLADTRQQQGNFDAAEPALRRGLAIVTAAGGPGHPRIADLRNDLGVLLRRRGDYAGAVREYRESVRIRTAHAGENDGVVALTLVNLSAALEALGESAEGLDLLRRAVRILEVVHGPEHSRTAWALSHLAQRERGQGNVVEAERLFERCLAIARALHGPRHPEVASYLVGIAQCQTDRGELEVALRSFESAAAIARETLGPGNPLVDRYARELGVVLVLLGRLEEGRVVLEQTLAALEEKLGPRHPALVRCLSGLTVVALAERRFDEALALADRRLGLAETVFGESGLRGSLLMRVAAATRAGRGSEAEADGLRAIATILAAQEEIVAIASEREALGHAARHREAIGALLAAMHEWPAAAAPDLASVFIAVAQGHGQVLDQLAARRQLLDLARSAPEIEAPVRVYRKAVEDLATRAAAGPGDDAQSWSEEVDALREVVEDAEWTLAAASERFRRRSECRRRDRLDRLETLASALPDSATLVHFVRHPTLTVGTDAWQPGAGSLTASLFGGTGDRYAAFRLAAGRPPAEPDLRYVDLGEADTIDSLVAAVRRATEAPGGGFPTARQEAEWRKAARALHDAIWKPLFGMGAGDVFVVATSRLLDVDFHALLSPEGTTVIESRRVHLLSSARDLLRFREAEERSPTAGVALLVGDPRSDGVPDPCGAAPSGRARLPAAAEEVERIAALFERAGLGRSDRLLGDEATEGDAMRLAAGRGVVHFATHGFFCDGAESRGGIAGEKLDASPLVECGLVLAAGPGDEDGLLTAQEIVALDLSACDCVVLSGCDTGQGKLSPGEGRLGLRRAFEIAGARTVVMSLGRVPDARTRDLSIRFHELRLTGRSAADALRLAELEKLEKARRRGRVHPALWGGFVVEGDWR